MYICTYVYLLCIHTYFVYKKIHFLLHSGDFGSVDTSMQRQAAVVKETLKAQAVSVKF